MIFLLLKHKIIFFQYWTTANQEKFPVIWKALKFHHSRKQTLTQQPGVKFLLSKTQVRTLIPACHSPGSHKSQHERHPGKKGWGA